MKRTTTWIVALAFLGLVPVPAQAGDPKASWKGELVVGKKPARRIAFGDVVDGKPVSFPFSGSYPIKVRDERDGWLRIFDGRREGWARKDEFVLSREAPAYFNARVRAEPTDAFAWSMRAQGSFDRGDYDKAIKDFSESIQLDEKEAATFNARGNAYAAHKEYERAMLDFNAALLLNPNFAAAYSNRGIVWMARKAYDIAIYDFGEAISRDPLTASNFSNRGNAWSAKKRYDRAIQDYDEAVRLDPNYAEAFNNRGWAWHNKRDYDQAISNYNEAIRLDPKAAYWWCNRASALAKKRQYKEAVRDFEEAVRLDPKRDWVLRDYAAFRAGCPNAAFRDGRKAVKMAMKAIGLAGSDADWEYLAALASAYAETAAFDRAVAMQKKAIEDRAIDAEDKARMEGRLKLYEEKKPYREE